MSEGEQRQEGRKVQIDGAQGTKKFEVCRCRRGMGGSACMRRRGGREAVEAAEAEWQEEEGV